MGSASVRLIKLRSATRRKYEKKSCIKVNRSSLSSVSSEEFLEGAAPNTSSSGSIVSPPVSPSFSVPVSSPEMVRKRIMSDSSTSNSRSASALACHDETVPSESDGDLMIDEVDEESSSGSEEEDSNLPDTSNLAKLSHLLDNANRERRKEAEAWEARPPEWLHGVDVKIKERDISPPRYPNFQKIIQGTPSNPNSDPLGISSPLDLKQRPVTERQVLSWAGNCPNLGFAVRAASSIQQKVAATTEQQQRPRRNRRPRLDISMKICKEIILELMSKTNKIWFQPFYKPFKGIAGTAFDFPQPIYLSEVKAKVMDRNYAKAEEFVKDMKTLISNFLNQYPEDHEKRINVLKLQEIFEKGHKKLKKLDKTSGNQRRTNRRDRQTRTYNNAFVNKQAADIQAKMALHIKIPPTATITASSGKEDHHHTYDTSRSESSSILPRKDESVINSVGTPETKQASPVSNLSTVSASTTISPNSGGSRDTNLDKQLNGTNGNTSSSTPHAVQNGIGPKRRIEVQSVSDSITKKIKTAQCVSVSTSVQNKMPSPTTKSTTVPNTPQPYCSIQSEQGQSLSAEDAKKINLLDDKIAVKHFGCRWLMDAVKAFSDSPSFTEGITRILGQSLDHFQESQLWDIESEKLSAVGEYVLESMFPSSRRRNIKLMRRWKKLENPMVKNAGTAFCCSTSTCEAMVQMQRMQEHGIKTFQSLYESRKFAQDTTIAPNSK
ncbi:Bromodomain-containing protein 2 [Orchesella cincta]|uniref:Bromodomain-containing protein 2 n=1 Tax=Orchesella cincta TaxID=48709 RepID=A0A1D2MV90_ORCCI|nr:Bromodomain-containing protein 2 [Orchesella cincta]